MSKLNNIVSVITPAYNSEDKIIDCIESVANQTVQVLEHIIVDDGSYDETVNVVNRLKLKYEHIILIRQKNGGAGQARNNAISAARGRYIAFLDADDLWHPEKLEKQLTFMQASDIAFSYTQYQKFSSSGELGVVVPPDSVSYDELLYSNVIGCLTAIYDCEKLGKRFMPTIRKRQDMGLWLSILKDIPRAYCLQENLAKYRIDSGMTKNKFTVLSYQWRFYRKIVGLSFLKSVYTFAVYAYRGFVKSKI